MADEMTPEAAAALREPFPPEAIGKLPKAGLMLDYVGHAATTDRLLQVDPSWTWEPMALDGDGLPLIRGGELWIRLTVCGVTRPGVGDGKSTKEMIGDAIRNAAMRFGVALDLWAKEDLHAAARIPAELAEVFAGVLNDAGAEARKAWMDTFGCRPADLPLSREAEAEAWLDALPAPEPEGGGDES